MMRDGGGHIDVDDAHSTDSASASPAWSSPANVAALFDQLLHSSSDAIWLRDPEGRFQIVNRPAARVLAGVEDPAQVVDRPMTEVWGEEFAAILQQQTEALFRSRRSETVEEQVFDSHRQGPAVFLSTKVPLFNEDGTPLGVLGVSRDITDLKRVEQELRDNQARLAQQVAELKLAQEREHLLAREVDHRAKNLLAVVQSVVQLSRAESVDELKSGLTGRIQSLGRAHSLLADARWEGVELTQLAEEELAPFLQEDSPQVTAGGPRVLLRPSAAQSLALVLHELTTNAAKYGALATPRGLLRLGWNVISAAEGDWLVLEWVETGGTDVTPPAESGFGSRLITTSIDRQLRGKVDREWTADGLRCTLHIPAAHAVVHVD